MKILHVTQGYQPAIGGTEWLIQRISEELVAGYGDEVTVFTTNCYNGAAFWDARKPRMPVGVETINGVTVRRFPVMAHLSRSLINIQKLWYRLGLPGHDWVRTWFGGPIIRGLADAIAAQPADLVSAASFPLLHMYESMKGARRAGKPIVFTGCIHPLDDWGFQRDNLYAAIGSCDRYNALTGYERDYLIAKGIDAQKIHMTGVGVDADAFSGIDPAAARAQFDLPQDKPVVGFIGQMAFHKGTQDLLKAMPMVWQEMENVHLLLAGSRAVYGEQVEKTVQSWPEKFRNQTTILFNFPEADKPGLFNALDVFVYPSGFESFGISYLEAWAAGKPVIGTWNGAIPSVVSAGRDGLLVPFQREKLLTQAILALVRHPGWARELGAAGREKVRRFYTWPLVAERYRASYQQALAR